MHLRIAVICLAFGLSGCTFTPADGGVEGGFHPPLVAKYWHTDNYTMRNGIRVCAVSSGYNGITVNLAHTQGKEDVVVQSNRMMQPGAELTVTVNSQIFRAYDAYFTPEQSRALAEALQHGDKAYFEWSEFSGPAGRERVHVQNIAQLNDFSADIASCRRTLAQL